MCFSWVVIIAITQIQCVYIYIYYIYIYICMLALAVCLEKPKEHVFGSLGSMKLPAGRIPLRWSQATFIVFLGGVF